jgi:hypothetical protein
MRYRVSITDATWSDMLEIGREIKRHNPPHADSFIEELLSSMRVAERFSEVASLDR